jgi:hypothetical protein
MTSEVAKTGMSADIEEMAVELARRDDFVVFAGTGVCSGAGLPTWKELLQSLEKACHVQHRREFDNPDEFPQLAQEFYNHLKHEGRENEYSDILKEQLRPRNALYDANEREIVETTGKIVTTNFDTTFQEVIRRVFPDCGNFVQCLPSFDVKKMQEQCVLAYLHGSSDDCIILKTDDYATFYPSVSGTQGSTVLEDYLKYLYLNHTLVFIGFSFNDRYMREALRAIHRRIAEEDKIHASLSSRYEPRLERVQHYAFLQQYDGEREKERLRQDEPEGTQAYEERLARIEAVPGEQAELDRLLDTLHIRVARYVDHVEWVRCFLKVQDVRRKRAPTSVMLGGNRR